MTHKTSYYSEPENKIEEERRMKILDEGVEKLNTTGIEAAGKLLKGDAVDKIVEYAHTIGVSLFSLLLTSQISPKSPPPAALSA